MIAFEIPGHIRSKTNARGHWATRAKVAKLQRQHGRYSVTAAFRSANRPDPGKWLASIQPGWVEIWFVRISPRALDDDNLRDALKSVRDGVADAFGLADNDARFSFRYSQRRGTPTRLLITIAELH